MRKIGSSHRQLEVGDLIYPEGFCRRLKTTRLQKNSQKESKEKERQHWNLPPEFSKNFREGTEI
jgi:hypothetical protein